MENALIYLMISAASYPFLSVYNSCAALFRSMGNSKISMQISLVINITNIILNAVFIFGFRMGVAGVALASCISRAAAAVYLSVKIRNPELLVYVKWSDLKHFRWRMVKNILRIGIPNALENSLFQLGRIVVVTVITAFGTAQVAANAVANNLDAIGCIPGQALNLAMITVVGQCIGAQDFGQAKFYIRRLMRNAYLLTGIVNILIIVTLPVSLKLYSLSGETLRLASIMILIHCGFAILLWPASFTLPNALRAASDVTFTMVVSIISMAIFRILASYIIGYRMGMGAIGVWIAMILDWICRASCFIFRLLSGKWQEKAFL